MKKILPLVITWMDLEGIMLSEISQTEKDKYCMNSLICGICKKHELIDTENRLMGWLPEVGGREWVKWMKVVKRCKLLAIR